MAFKPIESPVPNELVGTKQNWMQVAAAGGGLVVDNRETQLPVRVRPIGGMHRTHAEVLLPRQNTSVDGPAGMDTESMSMGLNNADALLLKTES